VALKEGIPAYLPQIHRFFSRVCSALSGRRTNAEAAGFFSACGFFDLPSVLAK
jgi:hypothetical protein